MYSYDEIIRRSRDAVMQEITYFATGGIERRKFNRKCPEIEPQIHDSSTWIFIKITRSGQHEKITRNNPIHTPTHTRPARSQAHSTLLHIPR